MKEKGKSMETHSKFSDLTSQIPCRKHPNPSQIGVCAQCLRGKLVKLAASDAFSSYRNSTSSIEFDSVGKFPFFAEKDETIDSQSKRFDFYRRSSSSCVDAKRGNGGLSKIKRLFVKKIKMKGSQENFEISGDQSEINWVSGGSKSFSVAKISDATNGFLFENKNDKFQGRVSVFPSEESGDFRAMDESDFIDLEFNLLSESKKRDLSVSENNGCRNDGVWRRIFKLRM